MLNQFTLNAELVTFNAESVPLNAELPSMPNQFPWMLNQFTLNAELVTFSAESVPLNAESVHFECWICSTAFPDAVLIRIVQQTAVVT